MILFVVRLRCLFGGCENSLNVERKGRRRRGGGDLTIILRTRTRLGNFGVGGFPFGAASRAADDEDVPDWRAQSPQTFTARNLMYASNRHQCQSAYICYVSVIIWFLEDIADFLLRDLI